MATVYEIIQGLSQAAANAYDGPKVNKGVIGLQREEGDPILDKRVMDGFKIKIYGNRMILNYQSEVQLKEVYAAGFEQEIEQRLVDITSWLKKEYKTITGNTVSLTEEGEVDIRVESTSRHRSWLVASKQFTVGGINEEHNNKHGSEAPLEARWQDFLNLGGWGKERPDNDTRKK